LILTFFSLVEKVKGDNIMQKITLSILSITALLSLSACGSDDKPAPQTTVVTAPAASVVSPTKGRQLEDLKKSYDDGIISKDEYKEQKARLLD
jgi:hypothetical protein